MALPFFTIGHSTRTLDEFVALLREAGVTLLVDVRAIPRSRTNPQYNTDVLPKTLAEFDIAYVHIAELGGRRSRRGERGPSRNDFWENDGFRNYADYAATPEFRRGFAELRQLGHERRSAIMCAEAVWWRCHRRIIADYLLAAGEKVFHILAPEDKIEAAKLTPVATKTSAGALVYPAEQSDLFGST